MRSVSKASLLCVAIATPFVTSFATTSCSISYKYPDYTLVCMGDSITYGYMPYGGKMPLPYPRALQAKLGFGHSYNYGICGSTIASGINSSTPMVDRVKNMSERADILIFWGGINDYWHHCDLGSQGSTSPNNVYGALDNVCQYITNKYTESFVMFITPLPITIAPGLFTIKDVRDAIIYTCNKYTIPVLDLYTTSGFEHEMVQSYSDGVHPTQSFVINSIVPKIYDFIVEHI